MLPPRGIACEADGAVYGARWRSRQGAGVCWRHFDVWWCVLCVRCVRSLHGNNLGEQVKAIIKALVPSGCEVNFEDPFLTMEEMLNAVGSEDDDTRHTW